MSPNNNKFSPSSLGQMEKPLVTNWIVITGAPSSGKSTLVKQLGNMGYKVCGDVAREVINEFMEKDQPINEIEKQTAIVMRLLQKYKKFSPDDLIIFDYGMPDNLVFQAEHGFQLELALKATNLIKYRSVILLMPLPVVHDGIREINKTEQSKIFHLIDEKYREIGYSPFVIPPANIQTRLKNVLEIIQEDK
jgi:predicted ATPase